jgi:hypothetical protein
MTCLMSFDYTIMYDYWPVPLIVVCTANFLTIQMLVSIGADSLLLQILFREVEESGSPTQVSGLVNKYLGSRSMNRVFVT